MAHKIGTNTQLDERVPEWSVGGLGHHFSFVHRGMTVEIFVALPQPIPCWYRQVVGGLDRRQSKAVAMKSEGLNTCVSCSQKNVSG